ncbi:MAG: Rne/Rng family ribonuclease [Clostridia bacterium]|nr:Rne/Rng family ribonuclease [Clostridia bacterium]
MKEILIKQENDFRKIYLIEEEKLVEYYEEKIDSNSIEGNIYIGKVQNVVPGLEAAFIDIGEEKNVFIHRNDLLNYNKELPINKIIKPGERILVQVMKDKIQRKGAKVTEKISLRGKLVVLHPNRNFITVSSKIKNNLRKEELKKYLQDILPKGMGAIARTSSEFASNDEIKKDLDFLLKKWKYIQNIKAVDFPKKIYDSGGILSKVIIDLSKNNLDKIEVNSNELKEIISNILKQIDGKINLEISNIDYNYKYNISKEINKMDKQKIWLNSGGFITIDYTEALIAIDVNTGKFIGKKNLEDTIYKVNEEAVIEIARQMRLRDLGGIIIIDFIDMNNPKDIENIILKFKEEAIKDRSKVQIEGFTKLNLLELTRKRIYINEDDS